MSIDKYREKLLSYDEQGRKHGPAYAWYNNLSTHVRTIRMEMFWVHGEVYGRLTRFNQNGKMRASEYWEKGLQEGEEIIYEYGNEWTLKLK